MKSVSSHWEPSYIVSSIHTIMLINTSIIYWLMLYTFFYMVSFFYNLLLNSKWHHLHNVCVTYHFNLPTYHLVLQHLASFIVLPHTTLFLFFFPYTFIFLNPPIHIPFIINQCYFLPRKNFGFHNPFRHNSTTYLLHLTWPL